VFGCILAAASMTLVLAAQSLAGLVPPAWCGNWTDHIVATQPHFITRFFAFDAAWYQGIAMLGGYTWDPSQPALQQPIAFFPLWPLIEHLIAAATPYAIGARPVWVVLAMLSAAASIGAFHRLAARLLPEPSARTATALYAFWPAACFLPLTYPTGLLNLLCVLALGALLDGALLRAAALAGIATATGPLALGTSVTVCLAACGPVLAAHRSRADLATAMLRAAALSVLSVSGLLAFMLYQHLAFGDPLAFIDAQRAWAVPASIGHRVVASAAQLLVLPDLWQAAVQCAHALRAQTAIAAQAACERAENLIGMALALIGIVAAAGRLRRLSPGWPVPIQALATIGLCIWFDGATRPGHATLRLIYPAAGAFMGLAIVLARHPTLRVAAVLCSAMLLAANAALIAAGYHVV